ncbi:LacI family transcriptional regulator [Isoptericola sp. 4D.3]|jgi:LacI family transcriptional regulator|uniref:LacI family transcriptional regulator n=1 Tax=Isoptericola peretonis TaxID=2918523 RepID=A0ABT0J4A5_9MICO|nr:LacI family transcriptional regulator [Isoptericola sp. 4D.3]
MRGPVPTLRDVAERAGVSPTTVSRVINASGFVSREARAAIRQAIDELGYVPSASARGLASRHTAMVGLCLPVVDADTDLADRSDRRPPPRVPGLPGAETVPVVVDTDPEAIISWGGMYFGEVVRGAEFAAWEAGLAITVAMTRAPDLEARVLNMAGRVDGMVVVSGTLPDDLLEHVARRVPVVILTGLGPESAHDRVTVRNAEGVERLVEHLLTDHGITSLEYVAAPEGTPDDEERFRGFCRALTRAGIEAPAAPRLRGDWERGRGREIARGLVDGLGRGGTLPGALVCCNDNTALGLLDVFAAHGVRVPEDVVVTGFDGVEAARTSAPPLTTVEQPMAELGRAAVEVLTARIAAPARRAATTSLPVTVVLRGSCGAHPPVGVDGRAGEDPA